MRILFIVPGSGDSFYCGNCFRDNLQANALRKAGNEVIIMPLYLPLKELTFTGDTPLFFPATSYYLSQKYFKKRVMPEWINKCLGSDFFLNIAASFSGSTSSEGLEDMTLSMINGDGVAFNQQVGTLVEWIKNHEKPDVVHLSSSLLLGIAKAIKEAVDIPLVCSLQDEEVWIDKLEKRYADIAWKDISDNAKYVDKFITSSEYYKNFLSQRLPLINGIEVVYPGIDTNKYASDQYPDNPVIGFFYRMNEENGLGILAEAYAKLRKTGKFNHVRLRIGGGYTATDKKFLKKIQPILAPYKSSIDWIHTYSLNEHLQFYKEISVICVPLTFNEGVGLYLCEAFAAGRPAIEPATGSFPEIVENAGILYTPNSADALAEAMEKLLSDEQLLSDSRAKALYLSESRYNQTVQAQKLYAVYSEIINSYKLNNKIN
jgi:glycosyltransferase involved in cell wall biosynthesis